MNRAQRRRRVAAEFYYKPKGISGIELDWIDSGVEDDVDPDVIDIDWLLASWEQETLKQLRSLIIREPITAMDTYHQQGQADMKRAVLRTIDELLGKANKALDIAAVALRFAADTCTEERGATMSATDHAELLRRLDERAKLGTWESHCRDAAAALRAEVERRETAEAIVLKVCHALGCVYQADGHADASADEETILDHIEQISAGEGAQRVRAEAAETKLREVEAELSAHRGDVRPRHRQPRAGKSTVTKTSSTKQYAPRAHECLDNAGNYYCRHVSAMTSEGLHEKSAIAGELAWRDYQIDRLKKQVELHQKSAEEETSRVRADLKIAVAEREATSLELEKAKDQLGQIAAELAIGPGDLDDGTYDEEDLRQAQAGFALSCLSPIGVEEVALMMAAARIRERETQRKIAEIEREKAQGEGRMAERAAILARILRFEQAWTGEPEIASALHSVYDAIEGGDVE